MTISQRRIGKCAAHPSLVDHTPGPLCRAWEHTGFAQAFGVDLDRGLPARPALPAEASPTIIDVQEVEYEEDD